MTLLKVENLDFGYGRRRVGSGIGFDLAGGDVMCLLGPNGSGKTTLFKTLLGLLPCQGGRIVLDDEPVALWSRRRFARAMAYVPQTSPNSFSFSALQTVVMGRSAHIDLFSRPTTHDFAMAKGAMRALGIEALGSRPVPELSGGERQLVMIARALAQEPRILVMDEPTANLDFGNRVKVLGQIRKLADQGIAVILSTHDPDHAFQIANQVALLHEGRQVACGAPASVITAESLRLVYGIDVSIVAVSGKATQHWVCLPDSRLSSVQESL
ncbi:ABC transporter ATP-binding protein [Telmatospirillum sp.]|uniref:ABC transporter ATP-binding protein n=1 Tax=Telmatospirillum sp. TaxID=2079197 RepID=UPI002841D5F6|nr:ABC transporter ATP-binding protein [Telmatospirillum sp.]MDR3435848.1 ABC transporter ATP-binding protein [Telmatospirillum sp.]